MTRLLIIGFGSFPGVPRNPTASLAASLAADPRWRRLGVEATALVLPTAYSAVEERLLPALHEAAPDAVLMLGVAKRRRAVCLETRAVNRVSRRLPDASGRLPASLVYRLGEPFVRKARASLPALAAAMRVAAPGHTRASRDAGRYLCNAAYFAALAETAPAAIVFVHVPMVDVPAAGRPVGDVDSPRITSAETRRALMAAALSLARASRRSHSRTTR